MNTQKAKRNGAWDILRRPLIVAFAIALTVAAGGVAQNSKPPVSPAGSARNIPGWQPARLGTPLIKDPIWVYNDWSSYDELSDNIPLTEELAMKELDEIIRLHSLGVHFDYYMMDAFWFAPEGATELGVSRTGLMVPMRGLRNVGRMDCFLGCGLERTNL